MPFNDYWRSAQYLFYVRVFVMSVKGGDGIIPLKRKKLFRKA